MRLRLYILLITILPLSGYAQLSFKGGAQALDSFLTGIIVYPEYSRQNCIAAVIKVKFKVDAKGMVSEAAVQDGLGIDLDDEAVRVIRMTSGKWQVPANYSVNSTVVLPIRFVPDVSRCNGATDVSRATAIANYKSQQELQNAVTNYYKNKYAGTADSGKEAQILALKKQLGYDDEFISDVLEQAGKKLKQGDKAGACEEWNFIRNIGSDKADSFIAKYCSK